MEIAELRQTLTRALTSAEEGNVSETVRALKTALQDVDERRFLTDAEAARLLGVRSVNTVNSWARTGYIEGMAHGDRVLIPMSEIERIQNSDRVHGIRMAEALHAESAVLGGDEDMSQEELDALDAGRPGTLPWQRQRDGDISRQREEPDSA